jgi:Mg-chelatase subunit ChlD
MRPLEGEASPVTRLEARADRRARAPAGKRTYARTDRKRGRYIRAHPARSRPRDVAFDATLRAAAPFQKRRAPKGRAFAIEREDIHDKVRVRRASNLILFTVDCSWSMSASARVRATREAILSLLTDAYQRRDRIGLVTFRGRRARLVLPPTSSVSRARKALETIPIGGKTPLGAALLVSREVLTRHKQSHPEVRPLLVLLTDAAANVSVSELSPEEEAHRVARMIRAEQIRSILINLENPALESGHARALAAELGARCLTVAELKGEKLYALVKREIR